MLEWCLQNHNFQFALEQTQPFIQVEFVSLEKASTMTQHSLNSKGSDTLAIRVQVATYVDRRYGRGIVNGSRSWPADGVDGMVWSGLFSINETRQSPAEQLQSAQPSLSADCDLGWPRRKCHCVEKTREEEQTERRWGNGASLSLSRSEHLIENTAP